jgi:undecaprenyl-phosphate galactose phosphotransferase/putative colanic acid biosynthesis UDP-glucose lipid carrier transferase
VEVNAGAIVYSEFSGLSSREKVLAEPMHRRVSGKIGYAIIEPLCAVADAGIIVLAAIASGTGYHFFLSKTVGNIESYATLGLLTAVIYVIGAHHLRLYRIQELIQEGRDYRRVLAAWAFAILLLAVILFVLKIGSSVSRGTIICFTAIGGICIVGARAIVKRSLRKAFERGAVRGRRAILLGDAKELALFGKRDLLIRFGIDEVERNRLPRHEASRAAPTVNAVQTIMQVARDIRAEEIILAVRWADAARLDLVRKELRRSPLPVRLLPDRSVSAVLAHERAWPAHAFLIELQRAPLSAAERFAKRALDLAVAGAALLVLAPLIGFTAVAIKLESTGPIIFKQRRKGFDCREFVIYKFRTMKVLEDGPAVVQATRGDARVTALGRFLRQTSIDELPQLLNVVKGDMSIVGPRPHAVAHDAEYGQLIANYALRHHVKPGITGWAQVHGCRGGTPQAEQMAKRIELDLWYIDNWSVLLDLQILIRTCFEVVRARNAF